MQAGELIVVKEGSVSIPLQSHPSKVICLFLDGNDVVPCAPVNYDKLTYSIKLVPIGFVNEFHIEIAWLVSGVRTIAWEVYY